MQNILGVWVVSHMLSFSRKPGRSKKAPPKDRLALPNLSPQYSNPTSQILALMVTKQNKPTSNLQTQGQERERHRNGQCPVSLDVVAWEDRQKELAEPPSKEHHGLYHSSQREENVQLATY